MWYVIHTMSGLEEKCMQQCRRYVAQSAYRELFIPQYIAKKHFKKEWHEISKILFPGYLFVDTETIEPVMEGLKKFRQYSRVLRDGEVVSPITAEEQEFLSAMMDNHYVVRYSEGFLIGEQVCILNGPLKDYQGSIKAVDRHRRVAKLEVPIFGHGTPVEVGFGAVARVSEEQLKEMIAENIETYQASPGVLKESMDPFSLVQVQEGIFKGMMGKFLSVNEDRDEWTVEIDLFGVATKVEFKSEEVKLCNHRDE